MMKPENGTRWFRPLLEPLEERQLLSGVSLALTRHPASEERAEHRELEEHGEEREEAYHSPGVAGLLEELREHEETEVSVTEERHASELHLALSLSAVHVPAPRARWSPNAGRNPAAVLKSVAAVEGRMAGSDNLAGQELGSAPMNAQTTLLVAISRVTGAVVWGLAGGPAEPDSIAEAGSLATPLCAGTGPVGEDLRNPDGATMASPKRNDLPPPCLSGLCTEVLPLGTAALEVGMTHLIEMVQDSGAALPRMVSRAETVSWLLAVSMTLVGAGMLHWQRRNRVAAANWQPVLDPAEPFPMGET